ncbi:hypothetical protein LPB41_21560 [Thalassospira sp. MA62]|nr:hypothetical protein [Thalassospira sp. MA62]
MKTRTQKFIASAVLGSAIGLASFGHGQPAIAQTNTPQLSPMPAGYNFPTPGYVIQQWITDAGAPDETTRLKGLNNIRKHGWDLWNAMSQKTETPSSPDSIAEIEVPIWTTWPDQTQALKPLLSSVSADELLFAEGKEVSLRHPKQFSHFVGEQKEPELKYVLEVEQFNRAWVISANTPQIVPFGENHYSILGYDNLVKYLAAFPPSYGSSSKAMLDFDPRAIETKPVYYALKNSGKTIMPYWRGVSSQATTNTTNPTPETWKTCVIVNADDLAKTGMREAKKGEENGAYAAPGLKCETYLYAPIGMIFTQALGAKEAKKFGQPDIKQNDLRALVAMHVNTKEVDSWTWQTYYWQGDAAFEANMPGDLSSQPDTLAAPWTSYAMCTAYDQSYDHGATMNVCYNPYLETSPHIPDGINSNCVTCHGSANFSPQGSTSAPVYPAAYDEPIDFGGPAFADVMKTDFSWTIADQTKKTAQ